MNRRELLALGSLLPFARLPQFEAAKNIKLLPVTAQYAITPPALNTWTDVPLSAFEPQLPPCSMVIASLFVVGTSNTGDTCAVLAANIDTNPANAVQVIEGAFGDSTTIGVGLVFIPVIGDHLRLYFNTYPTSPLIQAVIKVTGCVT